MVGLRGRGRHLYLLTVVEMAQLFSYEKRVVEKGKRIKIPGSRSKLLLYPRKGDEVSIHYKMTMDGSKFILDDTWDKKFPLSFRVGEAEVIQGLDEAVLSMCLGERADLNIPSEYAYGVSGLGRYVPPNTNILVHVQLVVVNGIKPPLFNR